MNRTIRLLSLVCVIFACIFLASCGMRENMQSNLEEESQYTDISVNEGHSFNVEVGSGMLLGMQFYQGESVQVHAKKIFSDSAEATMAIYVHRTDGSSELLVEGIPFDDGTAYGYISPDGCYYIWGHLFLKKLDKEGKELFNISLEALNITVQDICQLADNRVFLLIFDKSNGTSSNGTKLAEMDAETGEIRQLNTVSRNDLSTIATGGIAAGEDGVMIMTSEGIWTLNVEDGSKTKVLSFMGSSYQVNYEVAVRDFRVLDDEKVEILLVPRGSSEGYIEVLERVDISQEKVPITLRATRFTKNVCGNWLKDKIVQFNEENGVYHIVMEECDEGTDPEDYAKLTSVEISTGKGPDILCGPILEDYIVGMIEKGAFVDLSRYLERSGIKKEEYFPCAFNCWRDGEKIYGVNFFVQMNNYHVSESVLGNREIPNIDTLAETLYSWQENAVYMEGYSSEALLWHFLEGSESLWGMVDWTVYNCNFKGDLFRKLLDVSKRYGDNATNGYQAVAEKRYCAGFYNYDTKASQVQRGYVDSGVLFDEGCYGAVRTDWILAVNQNSTHKDGAWEFISYLLTEEAQATFRENDSILPVHRGAFHIIADKAPDPNVIISRNGVEVQKATPSEVAEMVEIIENARPLPIRTVPILDIICEEAGDYFEGRKSVEEVIAVIENRVQLYLEEQR